MVIVENILSEDLFAELRRHSRTTKPNDSSVTRWSQEIIGLSSPILLFDIPPSTPLAERCKSELSRRVDEKYRYMDWYLSIHLGGRMSYIPWHDDEHHKLNITIFLNDNWVPNHAGYFIYKDERGVGAKAILPHRNLGLIYEAPLTHSVTLATIDAPLRESLQIFVDE